MDRLQSISNDVLVREFGRPDNKVKQQNLNNITLTLIERYRATYKEHWEAAKTKIDTDADEYKKRIMEKMKP
ncbi:hypothetical protein [Pseudomonas sp. LH1G9]|uniref:hypothetical protein n=1 Tax=Pseudomonas sp. LH1G9 TaxID=2083055 RepID=UPI001319E478|nr:hypothetical protein [Pseudomonas sp. LH1G9]